MKDISKLLEKEKWEIKSLGDIATDIYTGDEVKKEQIGTGTTPAVKCGDVNSSLGIYFHEPKIFVDENLIKRKKYFEHGDILISEVGEKETIGSATAYLGHKRGVAGKSTYVLKHNQNPLFMSYMLSSKFCRKQIRKSSFGGAILNIYIKELKKIKIPLPPRHIQDLIADYLDHWTNLEQELEKELAYRKKQYQHYKELILISEKDKWETKAISEIITEMYSGHGVTKSQLGTGDYPAIKCGDVNSGLPMNFTECISFVDPNLIDKPKFFKYEDVLVGVLAHKVEAIGKAIIYLGNQKCIAGSDVVVFRSTQNQKYLTYLLSSKFCRKQIEKSAVPGAVVHLYPKVFKKIKIPLPPLEEQEKIVSKLDKFRTITEDLEKGIPKLLTLTRQQYEYYKEEILKLTDW